LLFSFSDVLKATNCTFQEVDTIFCPAVGIAVYDEFFSCMCAAEFLCALDVFARHTSSQITFLTLTIVGRSRNCTFINLYVGFQLFYVCIFIWVTFGSFFLHIDRQKLFLKL
jgi:hypothetical protein